MAANMQKIKLLKLYELLRKETDESHPISRVELCRRLNEMGISSNVRTLSLDIEVMQDNGFEIMSYLKDKEKFYYVPEHELTVPEIKILIDAVQAASFVTEKKTAELVEKVAALGGSHQAELLKENMVCFNTRKHTNESILYTVDGIEDAIIRRKKIAFNYFHLNEKAERVFVTTGTGEKKRYYVEPVALIFNEDNYYLMAYSNRHPERTASYRVDRMDHLEVVEESVLSDEAIAKIDGVAEFTEQAFKMFSGDLEDVVLQFDKSLIGPVFDKFGESTAMMPINDTTCAAIAENDLDVDSERMRWSVRHRFENGWISIGSGLYGLRLTAENELEIVPEEAAVIRYIFDAYVNGGLGSKRIADALNETGVKTRSNGEWNAKHIVSLLRNEKYKGDVIMGKSVSHFGVHRDNTNGEFAPRYYMEDTHEAIVDKQTWEAAQQMPLPIFRVSTERWTSGI